MGVLASFALLCLLCRLGDCLLGNSDVMVLALRAGDLRAGDLDRPRLRDLDLDRDGAFLLLAGDRDLSLVSDWKEKNAFEGYWLFLLKGISNLKFNLLFPTSIMFNFISKSWKFKS